MSRMPTTRNGTSGVGGNGSSAAYGSLHLHPAEEGADGDDPLA